VFIHAVISECDGDNQKNKNDWNKDKRYAFDAGKRHILEL